MTLRPSGDYADYYPNVVHRLADWRAAMRSAPRRQMDQGWVRDLPAARQRRLPGAPLPKLLEPVGYKYGHNRYSRKEAFPAIYFSDGVTTASSEVFGVSAVRKGPLGVPTASRLQLVVTANLPDVLDLTSERIRKHLSITRAEITHRATHG